MKKNKIFRIGAILLVAVLITTCAISGTFAKYITKDADGDAARVAKWGVQIEVGSSMFDTKYETDDTDYSAEYSVISSTAEDVLAPGTKGIFAAPVITGTPEVAVHITQTHKIDLTGDWVDADGNFYCPITIYAKYASMPFVSGGTVCGLDYDSAEDFEEAVNEVVFGALSQKLPANSDLSTSAQLVRQWGWEWAFEGAAGSEQNDIDDTFLGDTVAGLNNLETPNIAFEYSVTVTQID